jgi:hypothetical protein
LFVFAHSDPHNPSNHFPSPKQAFRANAKKMLADYLHFRMFTTNTMRKPSSSSSFFIIVFCFSFYIFWMKNATNNWIGRDDYANVRIAHRSKHAKNCCVGIARSSRRRLVGRRGMSNRKWLRRNCGQTICLLHSMWAINRRMRSRKLLVSSHSHPKATTFSTSSTNIG